jgi:putative FmdB family regulatory protein
MPIYEYEHQEQACKLGKRFEHEQPITAAALTACPECGGPVKRLLSAPMLRFPKSDSQLKNLGFSKLVRRDHGVYENVTAQDGESKIVQVGDQKTYPKKRKRDK